jgi:hypothetical protein
MAAGNAQAKALTCDTKGEDVLQMSTEPLVNV